MAFAIGYNVKQANELMDNIAEAYKNLGIYTKDQWKGVTDALQTNWVGEDEQDFENKLAERICKLYMNAYALAEGSIKTIAGLSQAWYDFQQKNTIDGKKAEGKGSFKVDPPKVSKEDKIVAARLKTIGNGDDRGLRDASSKTAIQGAVETFINQIKSKTKGLYEEIEANKAFFGDQTSGIKTYIEKVGAAIGEVTVAVKDMYDALDKLANSSYTGAVQDVSQQMTTSTSNVESSLNDLAQSRWV